MKGLIFLPHKEVESAGGFEKALFRPICGVPLLVRIIENSIRKSGVSAVTVIHSSEIPDSWLAGHIKKWLITPIAVETLSIKEPYDSNWAAEVWPDPHITIPWNIVADIFICSKETAAMAERELVKQSGKASDGIFSRFNRRLCWPTVRFLSHARVRPNLVSFAGLLICVLSAISFSAGFWSAYLGGALLFFIAGLCDEMDGMLARLTFQESAFGCWLESFADYAGYLLIFSGMTVGLYRERGVIWLILGGLFVFGCMMSMIVAVRQRKLATSPDRPQDFLKNYYRHLEADSSNWISRRATQVQFLMKKSAIMHEIIFFSAVGLLPLFIALGALSGNLIWILALYFGSKFFRQKAPVHQKQG